MKFQNVCRQIWDASPRDRGVGRIPGWLIRAVFRTSLLFRIMTGLPTTPSVFRFVTVSPSVPECRRIFEYFSPHRGKIRLRRTNIVGRSANSSSPDWAAAREWFNRPQSSDLPTNRPSAEPPHCPLNPERHPPLRCVSGAAEFFASRVGHGERRCTSARASDANSMGAALRVRADDGGLRRPF